MMKCTLFTDDPALAGASSAVRSPVSVDDFHQFVWALENKDIEVTNVNVGGLSLMSDEFGFVGLTSGLW
jgi:hypothetical protein